MLTLSKLAKLANVSPSVASKAFAGKEDVSEEMRERVFRVAREQGCFYQFYKAPYNRRVIAVLIPESISGYYIEYVECLKKIIEEHGFTMLLSIDNFDTSIRQEQIRYYVDYCRADALIAVGEGIFPKETNTVCLSFCGKDEAPSKESGVYLLVKQKAAIAECVDLVLEKGHREIGFIGEGLTTVKMNLLRDSLQSRGVPIRDEWFVFSERRFADAGLDGVNRLMKTGKLPSVIFCGYSYIAQGAIRGLRQAGISVPEQVSIVSIGSGPSPIDPEIDVARIDGNTEENCRVAMEKICERLDKKIGNAPESINASYRIHYGNSISDRNK